VMLEDLIILNLAPDSALTTPTALTNLQWQTCLRRIVFLHRSELSFLPYPPEPNAQIYRGRDAYVFLLEVICGLHSPLLGETAVMGQFRDFRARAKFGATAWGRFLQRLTTDLLVDARAIRHEHLQNLGSQSYGSLIRRYLKASTTVAVVGAGSLTKEILPWLDDVRLFYRNWRHAQKLAAEHSQIRMDQFAMVDAGWDGEPAALVVAAPLNATEISQWLALQRVNFSVTLDLRGNAGEDPIDSAQPVINLAELFSSLREERGRLTQRMTTAREAISALTCKRLNQDTYHAAEGEELCA